MSSTLVLKRSVKITLSDELKYKLQKKFQLPVTVFSDEQNVVGYLEALRDSEVKDADKVLEALSKFGEITLDLSY